MKLCLLSFWGDKYNTIASPSAVCQKHLSIIPQSWLWLRQIREGVPRSWDKVWNPVIQRDICSSDVLYGAHPRLRSDSEWLRTTPDDSERLRTTPDDSDSGRLRATPNDSGRLRTAPDDSERLRILQRGSTFRSRFRIYRSRIGVDSGFLPTLPITNLFLANLYYNMDDSVRYDHTARLPFQPLWSSSNLCLCCGFVPDPHFYTFLPVCDTMDFSGFAFCAAATRRTHNWTVFFYIFFRHFGLYRTCLLCCGSILYRTHTFTLFFTRLRHYGFLRTCLCAAATRRTHNWTVFFFLFLSTLWTLPDLSFVLRFYFVPDSHSHTFLPVCPSYLLTNTVFNQGIQLLNKLLD